jgi:hypothetical protein
MSSGKCVRVGEVSWQLEYKSRGNNKRREESCWKLGVSERETLSGLSTTVRN